MNSALPRIGARIVTVTSKGQFTIPKRLRDWLSIKPGDQVAIMVEGDTAVFTPLRKTSTEETGGSLKEAAWVERRKRT